MKRKITLLLLAAGTLFTMKSQVVLQENFTATFTPASAGWGVQNLSSSPGTLGWFQGSGAAVFPAYNGAQDDYFAANYNSQAATPGGISNWLITPAVTIYNGAVLQFATRTPNAATVYPDRLQIRMSTNATNSVIPTGTTSVGSFTDLLFDINPSLLTSTTAAVTSGTMVNGYPNAWTVYSVQVSGVTGTVTGRFAFRYFVDDAGPNGNNSSYIGLDAVKYTLPCGASSVPSFTTCSSTSSTLQATGLPATTYSWSTGATTSSIVVNPSSSTNYTVYPVISGSLCGNSITASITVASNLNVNVSASVPSVCAGESLTLTASGPATNYTWAAGSISNTIATTPAVVVSPTATTTYSVAGVNGFCFGGNSITVNVTPNPTVYITTPSSVACVSGPSIAVSFTGNGATNYVWVLGSATAQGTVVGVTIPAQSNTTSAASTITLGLIGVDNNGCFSSDIYTLTVNKTPTISVTSATASACTNSTVNITAAATNSSSVGTYSWSGAGTGTTNPLALSTGATAGVKVVTVVATSAGGCTTSATFSQNVVVCNTSTTTVGLSEVDGYQETAIFPNPFTNEISVNVLDGQVIIYNAIGQVVISTAVRSSETINTADLPKGAYFVKALNMNGEVVKTVKLIKN